MIPRTPVCFKLPLVLHRKLKPVRTPVVDGVVTKPIKEIFKAKTLNKKVYNAAIKSAGSMPGGHLVFSAIRSELLHKDCTFFAGEIIRGPKGSPYNGKFLVNDHHIEWGKLLRKHNRLSILAARDHGKSYYFNTAYTIWRAGYNHPGCLTYIFSSTQTTAEAFLEIIKNEILENPKLQHLIPYGGTRLWSARKIKLRNGSVIRACGFGVKVRGGHPNYIVCDDVLDDEDIYSETIRNRNIDYYLSAITNMVVPGGQIILVGTPFHHADLYDAVKTGGQYCCEVYPAIDKFGKPLFEGRYSLKALAAKRKELKSAARFAREFLCLPLSDEASLFPTKLFEGEVRLPYKLGMGASYWNKKAYPRYTGVDIAMSAEVGADYFVIFTVAVSPSGVRYLANIRRGKGWSFHKQIDEIKDEYYFMRPEVIHIEANQMQRVWTDEIVDTTDIPVRKFFTTGVGGTQPQNAWKKGATSLSVNKHHIDRGVPSLRMLLENKKFRIPRGDENSIELTDLWIGEMAAIGWINGKVESVGKHDDLPMACWMCDTAVRMGSSQFDFLEDMKEESKDLLKAPKGVETGEQEDLVVSERKAMSSVQQKKHVKCEVEAYHLVIRQSLHNYVSQLVEQEDNVSAVWVLREIKRLDTLFGNQPLRPQLVSENWEPTEGSLKVEDLNLLT